MARNSIFTVVKTIFAAGDPGSKHVTGQDYSGDIRGLDVSGGRLDVNATRFEIPTPTAALTALDFVEKVEVTNFFDRDNGSGILESINLICKDNITIGMRVHVFSQDVTVASAVNAALDISDAEIVKSLGSFIVQLGTAFTSASNRVLTKTHIGLPVFNDSSSDKRSLWFVFQVDQNTDYVTTNGLSFRVGGIRT